MFADKLNIYHLNPVFFIGSICGFSFVWSFLVTFDFVIEIA